MTKEMLAVLALGVLVACGDIGDLSDADPGVRNGSDGAARSGGSGSAGGGADGETPSAAEGAASSTGGGVSVGGNGMDFVARSGQLISDCMRPCAVQLDAQAGHDLTWDGGDGYGGAKGVAELEFVWDFGDGGGTADADGYLAAAIYETAGTYTVGVTVDGEAWDTQDVTVVDPTWIGCVSPTSNFAGCPTGNTYTTVSAALAAAGSQKRHVLLRRGESHGSLPSTDAVQTMIGAYGTGSKPAVSARSFPLTSTWRLVDLDITGSGSATVSPASAGGLMLRIDGSGSPDPHWMQMNNPVFVVDSTVNTGSDYILFYFDNSQWGVVQGSTFYTTGSQHAVRVDGNNQRKWLFKNSSFDGNNVNSSIRLSGATEWMVLQGNTFGEILTFQDSNPGDSRVRRHVIAERNVLDRNNYTGPFAGGAYIAGQNHLLRNNVGYHDSGSDIADFTTASVDSGAPSNVWFVNNTSINSNTVGFAMANCSTCVAVNNLSCTVDAAYGSGCISGTAGVTVANNWCYSPNGTCLDPVDGDGDCHDPNFVSTTIGHADFARPGLGAAGMDNGNPAPVWNDLHGDPRVANIYVGAVER